MAGAGDGNEKLSGSPDTTAPVESLTVTVSVDVDVELAGMLAGLGVTLTLYGVFVTVGDVWSTMVVPELPATKALGAAAAVITTNPGVVELT